MCAGNLCVFYVRTVILVGICVPHTPSTDPTNQPIVDDHVWSDDDGDDDSYYHHLTIGVGVFLGIIAIGLLSSCVCACYNVGNL